MSEQLITSVVTVITAIIGVAILAVLVSRQSNTTGVINAAASGFATDLAAALSPVTGGGGSFGIGGIGYRGGGIGISLPPISIGGNLQPTSY